MQFALSEEQAQLAEIAHQFLGELARGRSVADGADPLDRAGWTRLVEEQGWQAMAIGEELGGFGFGWIELCVVFDALGRHLSPLPMLGTAMATAALLESSPNPTRDSALERIATGIPATLALDAAVIDAGFAQLFVALTPGGLRLLEDEEVHRQPLPSLDATRPLYRLQFDSGAGARLDAEMPAVRARCETLLAWECVGAAAACLQLAVDYAGVRKQFGKPIGSFQAIQHILADVFLSVESARSAAWYAAWAVQQGTSDARSAAHTAKAMASEALFEAAGQCIQVHGGIGFTWEHDAHLYFKRAQANMSLLGSPRAHRAAVADMLLGAP